MADSSSRWTVNRSYLLLAVLGLSSIATSKGQAGAPNQFQKDRVSASGMSVFVYSCRDTFKKQRPDLSKRFGWRHCGCVADWTQKQFGAEMDGGPEADVAAFQRRYLAHPGLVPATKRCIDFALRTESQSGPIRNPYTRAKEASAAQIARRFDKCYFAKAKGKTDAGIRAAMKYCTCKVDAERAGYSAARIAELCK